MYAAPTDDAVVPAPLPQYKLAETTYHPTVTPCGQGRRRRGALVIALVLGAACQGAPVSTITAARAATALSAHASGAADELTDAQRKGVTRVRDVTERFKDIGVARSAGYTSQYPAGCAASSAGGQGFHYLNPALVDANVDLLRPELVLYEPQADGSMVLVGVDYVVPFTAWTSERPPMLLGVPFMRNEPLGVWALHIWAWRHNDRGMFAMWNPAVSCTHAK